jgi:hypothetical protein
MGVAFVVAVGQTGSVQTVTAAERGEEAEIPASRQVPRRDIATAPEVTADRAGPRQPPQPMAAHQTLSALPADRRRRIESALSELLEAKRLLDQVR